MAGSPRNSLGNVRSDMDITYPEHLSRLNRHLIVEWSKPIPKTRKSNRPRNRYRTQPVTFDEIQEVDEESTIIDSTDSNIDPISSSLSTKLDMDLFRLSKTLGSKLKKTKSTESGPGNNILDQNKEEAPVQTKALEQLRRTEKGREGSI